MIGWRAEQYGKRSLMWSWLLWSDREKVSYAVVCFESLIPWIDCFELDVFNVLACLDLAAFCGQKEKALEAFWWFVFCQCIHCFDCSFWCSVEMYCWDHTSRCSSTDDLAPMVGGHWFHVHVAVTLVQFSSKMDHDQQGLLTQTWNTWFSQSACAKRWRKWKAC